MILNLENISLAFGLQPLLDRVKLQINKGERVCLIGRNGAGKSSLLKIIAGSIKPDSGTIWQAPHLKIATLSQDLPENSNKTVFDFVAEGLSEAGLLLSQYHELTLRLTENSSANLLTQLENLQHQLDSINGWQFEQNIKSILSRLHLNAEQKVNNLSGGWQRRAALARALVKQPDLLLLDEPTNHLDIEAITALEEQLLNSNVTLLFITHDRALLQRLATRIIELDRGNLLSFPCSYEEYLHRKEALLDAENKENADFDRKLAAEEVWIRQGIKARRTRNEGRVRHLKAMRVTRAKRREEEKSASFNINASQSSGQLIVDVKQITYQEIIKDFSIRIMRGDRMGLLGPNGVGKTTLLNLLLGNLSPDKGTVSLGTQLQIAYFDQLRKTLDLDKTVIENVGQGQDFIEINQEKRHILSYLRDFLFTPERAMTPVRALSGGERNRLLLARLFSIPANLLVLDEPTNDLDIETLELLEEILTQFKGTLLIVSHDRVFLNQVVTSTLVFLSDGKIKEVIGGYEEAMNYIKKLPAKTEAANIKSKATVSEKHSQKLSYKEEKELASLPQKIEKLELEIAELQTEMANPLFYKQEATAVNEKLARLGNLEQELKLLYERWELLER